MSIEVGKPQIGQWYAHRDKGERFQVTAIDEASRSIELQYFDGDLDEVDENAWYAMSLDRIEPPEDCTGVLDDVETDDLGYSETDMSERDWQEPLQPFAEAPELWQDTSDPEERDPEGEGVPEEPLARDEPEASKSPD